MRPWILAALSFAALTPLAGCNRPVVASSAAPAAASAAVSAAPAPQAAAYPHRKAGLWRQTMSMAGGPAMPATEMCLDDASQAKLSMVGQEMSRNHCSPPQFTRNPDGSFSFTASCDMGEAGRSTTTGTVTGDFNSSYQTMIDSKITGAATAAANGEHKMTMTATWLGPCTADQKPGDMIMSNGMKMNMLDRAGG
ncbi:DUF3617 domain-containing protein [Phenylobacterium montanum]|uniref:DUF3617 domain-containing protein n=1 Tax=Phenylobacterium montanum TaxID=2823693 RepID=A0A975G3A4_9CAUL|nr:DUF3617 family protein [Caulobacter sp. S6]QUD89216.1 hypothetical protein KCG34_04865 [Caulobacter sp. S6]